MTFEKLCERAFEQVASRLASFIRLKVILKKNKKAKWQKEKTGAPRYLDFFFS